MRSRSDLTINDLALAYELRQEGCCWKRIAQGLGCREKSLRKACSNAIQFGVGYAEGCADFKPELLACMSRVKQATRLSWASLAEHIGTTGPKLRWAVKVYRGGLRA